MNQRGELLMPRCRINHCMTSFNHCLIIYGGYDNDTGEDFNELLTYNIVNGVWRRYQQPLEIRDTCQSSSICAVGNLVYIFGGECYLHQYWHTNILISFDIINARWKIIYRQAEDDDLNRLPLIHYGLLFYHNGFLYILGVNRGNVNLETMYKFCLKTSKWSLVQQNGIKPIFYNQIYGTVFKNQLYLFEDTLYGTDKFRNISIFDLLTNVWSNRVTISKNQQYPEDRIFESFAFSGNFGYMSGGRIIDTNITSLDIWKFDLQNLEWNKMEDSLQVGHLGHRLCVVNDCFLFSFGGYDHRSSCRNTLERFTIGLPSLFHLSLESVCRSCYARSYLISLPSVIVDEYNLNDHESSFDV